MSGGAEPLWSHGGNEILFRKPITRELWSVPVTTSPTFTYGAPKLLFSLRAFASRPMLAPDDSKFLFVRPLGVGSSEKLIFMENWAQLLESRGER